MSTHGQRAQTLGLKFTEQELDWRKTGGGELPVLEFSTDYPRAPIQARVRSRETIKLDEHLWGKLTELSAGENTTLFNVVLAGLTLLLYRYTGQERIIVGSLCTDSCRGEESSKQERVTNLIALHTELTCDLSTAELVRRVTGTVQQAEKHRDYPFDELARSTGGGHDPSRAPIFQVMLILCEVPFCIGETAVSQAALEAVREQCARCDAVFLISWKEHAFRITCEYDAKLYAPPSIRRLLEHFHTVLQRLVADPSQRVSELPFLSESERHQLLVEWNETRVDYPLHKTLNDLFEAQVERSPEAIAVVFENERLTYGELNQRANQLAHHLKRLGVGPEVLVGVFMERSLEMVIGLYGILKAGGAYVPIDPDYPAERIGFMVQDSQVPVLLTQQRLVERLPEHKARLIRLDSEWPAIATESGANLQHGVKAENLAYVIYTSGSTGRPKGAMNTHRGICNRLLWMQEAYCLTDSDVVLQKTPFSFDVSVWEFFWPLLAGARLVVARPEGHKDSAYLAELIVAQGITTLHFVPSMLQIFLKQPGVEACRSLKRVICSGEALSYDLQERFFQCLSARLHNLYGPTETAVDVTFWECQRRAPERLVPIGRPIANTQMYILDTHLQPVPMGVAGELHIGGVQVGRGYLNRPELTAEKFITDPFSADPNGRLYKTGDLARYLPDGVIEYLGRLDHQVKIRGFRIELGEIEATLSRHPAVRDAVVLAREDAPGDKRLVGYLVLNEQRTASVTELRSFLLRELPEFMVPSAFVMLDALPLSPNGKVDRRALPAPAQSRPLVENPYTAPRTALEHFLVKAWQETLGLEGIGIYDNFFELGGDSIQGAVILNKVQDKLGEPIYIVAIFEAPNIADFTAFLSKHYRAAVLETFGPECLTSIGEEQDMPVPQGGITASQIEEFRRIISPLRFSKESAKNPRAIFVLAPPRSGSTLLRVMLAGHPRVFAPQELELLAFNTLAEMLAAFSGQYSFWLEGTLRTIMELKGCDADQARGLLAEYARNNVTTTQFYGLMQDWVGEKTLVDKTPSYTLDLNILERIEADFDNALYIHLLRHPYAMIQSFEEVKLAQVFFRYRNPFSERELAELIWLCSHENILAFLKKVPGDRQYRVRFEDLVKQPEHVMEGVCQFVGLDMHENMLQPYKDNEKKMMDGIYSISIMRGDPKFHKHVSIDPEAALRWKKHHRDDFLGEMTWHIAKSLGYVPPDGSSALESIREQAKPNQPIGGQRNDQDEAAQLLASLGKLSDDEVEVLLDSMLAGGKGGQ